MCGRYTLTAGAGEVATHFAVPAPARVDARYNVAPSQEMPAVCLGPDGERELVSLRWGLLPSWARDRSLANRLINARAETVDRKPAFRAAFRHRRCLIPASGFYEWRPPPAGSGGARQPFYIHPAGGGLMAFAGLWEHWTGPDGEAVRSFTIITTEANDSLRALHDRMPVVIAPADYGAWLDPGRPGALALLRPCEPDRLRFHPVSTWVNNPRHDAPACLEPASAA